MLDGVEGDAVIADKAYDSYAIPDTVRAAGMKAVIPSTPFNGGPATWNDDIVLEINRHGFAVKTHFTIADSPMPQRRPSASA